MTDEQKSQFLDLAAQHIDLLKGFYRDVQLKYFGRVVTDFAVLPQGILDAWSGVPSAVKESLRLAGLQMAWLTESAPQVPLGGPPHGTPENWVAVWVDTANSTEALLHTAMQTIDHTEVFAGMIETWRRFGDIIKRALAGAGKAASDISGALIVIGVLLIIRELKR